jgi:phenylacetic acid degradation operon negative regulatory protein
MTVVADDVGAPPRTTVSLLRSFVGAHLRQIGGSIAVADLVELMRDAGASGTVARSALSRLKGKGLLLPESVAGRPGYRIAPAAEPMLARGDRRIYGYTPMGEDDPWMLLVFSVPEQHRKLRHQLRARLVRLGCGRLAPGTWIGPGHLLDEATAVLAEHDLLRYVTVLETGPPRTAVPLATAVQSWWDLDDLNARYQRLIETHEPVAAAWRRRPGSDREAFLRHLHLVDDWRSLPYLDPGLPPRLLPPSWLGQRGRALFADLHAALAERSRRHVRSVTG